MTDNRTTELLDGLRNVGNLHEFAELFGFNWHDESDWTWHDVAVKMADELEHAIAATLGSDRHPYEQRITGDGSDWGEIMCSAFDALMAAACDACTLDELERFESHIMKEMGE